MLEKWAIIHFFLLWTKNFEEKLSWSKLFLTSELEQWKWADEIKPDSDGSSKSFLSFESTEKDAAAELLEGHLNLVAGMCALKWLEIQLMQSDK